MSGPSKSFQLYLLLGDAFLRQRKFEALAASRETKPPEIHLYHDWDFDPPRFLEEARTMPLFSARQALVIRGADRLRNSVKKTLTESLTVVPPFTAIFLEADEMGEDDLLFSWVQKFGEVVDCAAGGPGDTRRLVKDLLDQKKLALDDEALQVLEERCSGDPALLRESIDKLALRVRDKGTIESEDVLALSERAVEEDGFALINAVTQGDLANALRILHDFFEIGKEPSEILGLINWHFKRIWQVRQMRSRGLASAEIGKSLRIPRFVLSTVTAQAERFTDETLTELVESLFRLDWDIKQGRVDPRIGIEAFLIKYCGGVTGFCA